MKFKLRAILPAMALGLSTAHGALKTVTFTDNDKFFPNPGMGPRAYAYIFRFPDPVKFEVDKAISHLDSFPGASILSLRPAWAQLEPQEGVFKWDWIDYAFEKAKERGFEIDLGTILVQPDIPLMVPQWVIDKGAKGTYTQGHTWRDGGWKPDNSFKIWVPNYGDSTFLRYVDKFAAAIAKRYGDRPEFIRTDVNTIGTWGEGHNWLSGGDITFDMQKAHLSLWQRNLPKQIHLVNDDYGSGALAWAQPRGFGLSEWSANINGNYSSTNEHAAKFWRKAPVVVELQPEGGYANLTNMINIVEAFHATTISINDGAPIVDMGHAATKANFLKAQKRMGYRYLPERVVYTDSVRPGGRVDAKVLWKNLGVAPIYKGAFATLTLKNEAGAVVATRVDSSLDFASVLGKGKEASMDSAAREWTHGLWLPAGLATGSYSLWISLTAKNKNGARLTLPVNGDDGEKRYRVGSVTITPAAPPTAIRSLLTARELRHTGARVGNRAFEARGRVLEQAKGSLLRFQPPAR